MAEIQFDKKLTLCLPCAPPCCCDVTHIYGGQFGLAGFAHISNLESRYEFLLFFFLLFRVGGHCFNPRHGYNGLQHFAHTRPDGWT